MKVENLALFKNKLLSSPFPLVFRYTSLNGLFGLCVSALSLLEISDLVARVAKPNLLLFEIDHCCWFNPENNELLTLKEIAIEQGVSFHAYDSETLALPKELFSQLMNEFDHYNFHLLDWDEIPDEITLIESIDSIHASKSREIVLPKIPQSGLWIDSHDDCSIYVESLCHSILIEVCVRAIKSLSQIALNRSSEELGSISISASVLNEILTLDRPLTILQRAVVENNCVKWPIFFRDFPWRSNGDLSKFAEFKKADKFLVLNITERKVYLSGDIV